MIIRAAGPNDLDGILSLAHQCPETPHWNRADYTPYLTPDSEPPLVRTLHVAADKGRLLGFAAATLLLDGHENRGELESIAVARDSRRQGIGLALVQDIAVWAARLGAVRLTLEVRAGNAAALALYRRAGFVSEGRRPRYYSDPEEDAWLLGRAVTVVSGDEPFSTGKPVEGRPPRC